MALYECRFCPSVFPSEAAADECAARNRDECRERIFSEYPRMMGWSFATFPADDDVGHQSLTAASDWCYWEPGNLYINGPVGAGKSGLAWGIVVHQIDENLPASFINLSRLLEAVKASYRNDEPTTVLDDAKSVYVLVLDDVGARRITGWARDVLADIVEHRFDNNRPTIVTSNYSPAELSERLASKDDPEAGQRIVSRLVGEYAVRITIDRPDQRMKGKAA